MNSIKSSFEPNIAICPPGYSCHFFIWEFSFKIFNSYSLYRTIFIFLSSSISPASNLAKIYSSVGYFLRGLVGCETFSSFAVFSSFLSLSG